MDSFQSPSPNDQRRFSATELAIGVNPELNAPWPDAAPQPTPVNQTALAPSAKTLELMRQLEALAHEIALVSRVDSSNQCIKVQEGSNFSAGLQLVEPSIRLSPRDQVATDSLLFGRGTNLTLVGFFTSTRDRLRSYRPSFGRPSDTLAGLFISVRDWLASYRRSFDRPSATLAGFFIAARDWLASSRTSLGRSSDTLAGLFIAVRDWLASLRRSFGRRRSTTPANFFVAALIGVAVAFVWQFQRVSTARSPNDVAAETQSGFAPIGQLSVQDGPPQTASAIQTAPVSTAPATSSELVQQLEGIARVLVVLQRRVEELAAKQEHLVEAQEQLAVRQEQMAQNIAKPQPVKLPRPRPALSMTPDRR